MFGCEKGCLGYNGVFGVQLGCFGANRFVGSEKGCRGIMGCFEVFGGERGVWRRKGMSTT